MVFDRSKSITFDVVGYVNSDYGGISYKVSLQSISSLSTTKAKYVAATKGIKEATWLWGLIIELAVGQGTTVVFSDSHSAIHLTNNNANHSKTKHTSVK